MKNKHILIVIISLFVNIINAQIEKGNWLVGGSGSFSNTQLESSANKITSYGFSISPNLGYFVADKIAFGLNNTTGYFKNNGDSNGVTFFSLGGFGRYYFLKSEKQINILTHVGYLKNFSKSSGNSDSVDLRVGPVFYFNSSVGLETTINYNILSGRNTNLNTLSFGIGFQIHLEK